MKLFVAMFVGVVQTCNLFADAEIVGGIEWSFKIASDGATVQRSANFSGESAIPQETDGAITVPSVLGGRNVIGIGEEAFRSCTNLTNITLPESITRIGTWAFVNCEGLTSITLPSAVSNIDFGAFVGCKNLVSIEVSDDNLFYRSINGVLYDKNVTKVVACPGAKTSVEIPTSVTSINMGAFGGCEKLIDITLPDGLTNIANYAFSGCLSLQSVRIPQGVERIDYAAFSTCTGLLSVVIPRSVRVICCQAFEGCCNLKSVLFEGDAPDCEDGAFSGTPSNLVFSASVASAGWGWPQWNGRPLYSVNPNTCAEFVERAQLTVTNVVIHYVVNSVVPEKVYPATNDTGFVNIITEVKSGGTVAVPATWADNYPDFKEKFGDNFTKSLMKPTWKRDGAGNAMCVWQDYVAGTDPTDENDKFTASITIDGDGNLTISYSPELTDAEKALRVYKTWGKVKLQDTDWVEVPEGHNADYNFFKVTVEMK